MLIDLISKISFRFVVSTPFLVYTVNEICFSNMAVSCAVQFTTFCEHIRNT
jgi:hypothetical protein